MVETRIWIISVYLITFLFRKHAILVNRDIKKPIEKQTELNKFYSRVKQFPMNKIICLDETSVGSALKPTYSRCELGRRCVIKTSNQFVFRKFTLLVAIKLLQVRLGLHVLLAFEPGLPLLLGQGRVERISGRGRMKRANPVIGVTFKIISKIFLFLYEIPTVSANWFISVFCLK